MLILQNASAAFGVCGGTYFCSLIVLGHGIGSSIEADYVNMGILKTIGLQAEITPDSTAQYVLVILTGMVSGILAAVYVSRIGSAAAPRLQESASYRPACRLVFLISGLLFLVLTGFIVFKARRLKRITPMKAIGGEAFIYGTR